MQIRKTFNIIISRLICSIFLITLSFTYSFAQKYRVKLQFTESSNAVKCGTLSNSGDEEALNKLISKCLLNYQGKGYIAARIDSVKLINRQVLAIGERGELYRWSHVESDSLSLKWLKETQSSIYDYSGKAVKPDVLINDIKLFLSSMENKGYPFVKVMLNHSKIEGNAISTNFSINPGPYIIYDTLFVKGDLSVSRRFLESYVDIKKGTPYIEKQLLQVDSKLSKLAFASIIKPSEVEFIPGKARIYTYLTKRKANRFSGLVGFSSSENEEPSFRFSGNLTIRLVNALKVAETLNINWNAAGEGKQKLLMDFSWPYIHGSNLAIDTEFILYKRDSTFLNLNPNINIGFLTPRGEKIGVGFEHKSSTVLIDNDLNIKDYSVNMVNLKYEYSSFTYQEFAGKGMELFASIGIGKRKVEPQSGTIWTSSSTYEFSFSGKMYIPFPWERLLFKVGIKAEKLLGETNGDPEKPVYNEMYRIGGSSSLRGFDEESILVDGYAISEYEAHLRISDSFKFFVFYDMAYASALISGSMEHMWPFGVGTGFLIQTPTGLLNITYAMGNGFGQRINIRDAKLHIGYIASF